MWFWGSMAIASVNLTLESVSCISNTMAQCLECANSLRRESQQTIYLHSLVEILLRNGLVTKSFQFVRHYYRIIEGAVCEFP